MTIKHMKIFIVVYQQLNVTKAARILHMTQPAVTRAIREIENYYNICLFERINRRLYRTELGEQLYNRAVHLLDAFDNMEKSLKNWEEEGILRIGSTITIGNFILPMLIPLFQEKYPKLKIKVKIYNCKQILQAVVDNKIDLALIEGECSLPDLHAEVFMEDHLQLVMALEHPLAGRKKIHMKDLVKYPLLTREEGSAGREYLDSIMTFHGIRIDPLWESVSSSAILEAVEKNIGIAILPERIVERKKQDGKIVVRKVEDEPFVRKNYIIWHKEKFLTRSAKEFIELCHSCKLVLPFPS